MGEIVHTSRIKIVREKGPTRRAMNEGFLYNKRIIQLVPHPQGRCAPQTSFLYFSFPKTLRKKVYITTVNEQSG